MSCVFKRGGPQCPKPASPACQEWGVGEGFCEEHIARVRSRLHNKDYSKDPLNAPLANAHSTYVEDYIKLFALMLDKSHCRTLMTALNNEMTGGAARRANDAGGDERYASAKRPDDKKYVRLSRVLEYYEGLCWFPTTHRLYTGALTSQNYQQSIALGYMPKDAGAGAQHGEYSHRLQWHMVMRVLTENFTVAKGHGWNHTPLALFRQLGSLWAMSNGIWGTVFDNQDGGSYDNPAKLNMDLCGNFKWRAEEAELSAAKWRAGNDLLASNARRRTSKRLLMYRFALARLAKYPANERQLLGDMDVEQNVIGLVEKWKKLGLPPPKHSFNFDPTKKDVMEKLARNVWDEFKLQQKADIYAQDETEPNALLRRGDTLMTPELIRARVQASYEGLNAAGYAYAENVGAYPKLPA
jgi:hypothetical protein